MFTLALGVFSLDLGCGEHFMVGTHEELFIPVGRGGLDSYSSLPGHDHSDLGLPTRPCLLKVLPAPNSENLGPCLNTWAFEGHSRSRLQQQPPNCLLLFLPIPLIARKKSFGLRAQGK